MKTFDDIQKLGMHDKVVHYWLQHGKEHGLSREQTLIQMVMELSKAKQDYFDELVKIHQNNVIRRV